MPRKGSKMPRWRDWEVELVRRYYSVLPSERLVDLLPSRTKSSIVTLAHRLGLRKTPERKAQSGRENVLIRWEGSDASRLSRLEFEVAALRKAVQ